MAKQVATFETHDNDGMDWEYSLATTAVSDENWSASIAMVASSIALENELIGWLQKSVRGGCRASFRAIIHSELLIWAEAGGPTGKPSSKSKDAYSEVWNAAKAQFIELGFVTESMVAKIVKQQVVHMKTEDTMRRVSPTLGEKGGKKEKGGKPVAEQDPIKLNKLKQSSDSSGGSVIADEPFCGPQLYIILFGFHEASILKFLEDNGIYVDTVVKIVVNFNESVKSEDSEPTGLRSYLPPGYDEMHTSQTAVLNKFWDELDMVLNAAGPNSKLNNIIIQEMSVRSTDIPSITNTAEVQEKFQSYLYTQMARLLYSVQDLKRHHRNYLRHLKLVRIPSLTEKADDLAELLPASPGLESSIHVTEGAIPSVHIFEMPDIQHYKNLMDAYPMECSTVPVILHCLLEQVANTVNTEQKKPEPVSSKKKEPPPPLYDVRDSMESEFDKVSQNLLLTNSLPDGIPTPAAPLILYHGDDLMTSTHHLSNKVPLNFNSVHSKMLHTHPVLSSVKKFPLCSNYQIKEQQARFHQFLSLFKVGEVSHAEIDRALKQFMFESMMIQVATGTGKLIKCPQSDNPWDDPYSLGKDGCNTPVPKAQVPRCHSLSLPLFGTFNSYGNTILYETEKIFMESCQSESQNSVTAACRLCWQPCYQRTCTAPTEITCECSTLQKPPICCECWNKLNKPSKQFDMFSTGQSGSGFSGTFGPQKLLHHYFRNLEDHVYIECFSPQVMYQVLYDAMQNMSCVDTFFCKRDRCHLLIMHNPCNCDQMQVSSWEVKLNTNIALRNFKMHVLDLIKDWIDEEEEYYQAMLKELRHSNQLKPSNGQKECVLPCTSVANVLGDTSWVPGIIQCSLKFKKFEERTFTKEKAPKEKDTQSKYKADALQKKSLDQTERCKLISERWQSSKRPSTQSPQATSSPATPERKPSSPQPGVNRDKEEFMFQGYNLGNVMLHISGSITNLYPGDGAQIRVESYNYLYGRTRTTVAIKHNNNSFFMHSPIAEHHSFWPSSFQALLSSGVRLMPRLVPYNTKSGLENGVISNTVMWGEPNSRSNSCSTANLGSPRHSAGKSEQHSGWSGWKACTEDLLEVTISLPNGLVIHVLPDNSNAQSHLLVRQTFTLKQSHLPDEVSRTITTDGQVIRVLTGQRTEVLQPDGTILKADWTSLTTRIPTPESLLSSTHSVTTGGGQGIPAGIIHSHSLEVEKPVAAKKSSDSEGSVIKPSPVPSPVRMYPTGPPWLVTTAAGKCFEIQTGVWTFYELYPMLSCVAVEPRTREKYITRDDGLHLIQKQGHQTIAHHYEGTRVTTFLVPSKPKPQSTETEPEIHVESPGFVPIVCKPVSGVMQLRITPDTLLTAKAAGHIIVRKDDGTELVFHRDGSILFTPVSSNKDKYGRSFSTYVMVPHKDICLEAFDQQGTQFVVQQDGVVNVSKIDNQTNSVGEDKYEQKARYFEVHEDGNGSEFISEDEMTSILEKTASKPYADIQVQPLPNDYYVQGVTVCLPLPKAPLDIWIIPYEVENIVPKGLTCHDLQPFARAPVKDNHYIFAYNLGSGLNIGSLEKQVTTLAKLCDPPQVWKVRRFLKYRKLCPELRYIFESKLKELNRLISVDARQKEHAQVNEYRDATEQTLAQTLFDLSKTIGVPRTCYTFVKTPEASDGPNKKVGFMSAIKKDVRIEIPKTERRSLVQEHYKYVNILRHNEIPGYFNSELARIQERKISGVVKRKKLSVFYQKTPPIETAVPFKEKTPPLMSPRQQKIMREIRTQSSFQLIKPHGAELPKLPVISDRPKFENCFVEPPSWAKVEAFQSYGGAVKRAAFSLKPNKINFGTVLEGHTYLKRVFLQNLGVSSSRFRVKQPPEKTGIRVFYNSVAVGPGIASKVDVELHAIMPKSVFGSPSGVLSYDLDILTEVETLHLPVEAKIVSDSGQHE